jgi:ribonuclease BN (tRNA processing enzyme)
MHLRILGCSGSRYPGEHTPAFLVDQRLLIDAGTVCGSLHDKAQHQIESILITHPHLDHVKGLANLADNLLLSSPGKNLSVYAPEEVIGILRKHLFNGLIWPDFGAIPDASVPVINWKPLAHCQSRNICGYEITSIPVTHSAPAVGYLIRSERVRVLFTGDTGPTERIWSYAHDLSLLISEVSFPNSLQELALCSGHLTPNLFKQELIKLPTLPQRIMIMHMKSIHREQIISEVADLNLPQIEIMQEGADYRL